MLPRIYRKWKGALPNLEDAPLFKVLGREKEYGEGIGKTYPFTEAEKDSWANLFEYKGSEENVRLKFAIDKIGATLEDVVILYEDSLNGDAWERFISSLKEEVEGKSETEDIDRVYKEPAAPVSQPRKWKIGWPRRYRWVSLIAVIGVVVGAGTLSMWKVYLKPAPIKGSSVEVETRGGSKNAEAYLKSVEANEQLLHFTIEGRVRARKLFEEAIALEPDFSRGYSGLALCYGMNAKFGGSESPKESMARAIGLAQKALSLNEKDAINHATLAYLLALTQQYDKAVLRAERALTLEGNSFSVLNFSGLAFMYSCRGREAIAALEKADRLNPLFPYSSLHLSWAYRFADRYEEAFKQAEKAVVRNPRILIAQLALTATSNLSGREAEARAAAEEVLKISPNFSVERYRNVLNLQFKDKDQTDITIKALRKAGLK